MRLHLTAVLSIIGCSYLSQAAECYAQAGANNCVDGPQLLDYRQEWCALHFNELNGNWWQYQDAAGRIAFIGKTGNFQNAQECRIAFADIVNVCYGNRNGGSWTWGGVSLNINFCPWPVVLPVEFQAQDCSL